MGPGVKRSHGAASITACAARRLNRRAGMLRAPPGTRRLATALRPPAGNAISARNVASFRAAPGYRARTPIAVCAALLVMGFAKVASAGGPLGDDGTPVTTSDYAIDLFQGPIFAGSRVTGLGGAYVAISEDVDGDLQNPASVAVRPFFSYTYFDYWLGFGLTFPASLKNMDFFNSGASTKVANSPESFVFFTPAVNIQLGPLGAGYSLGLQQYQLTPPDPANATAETFSVSISTMHFQVGYGFARNQWVAGFGARYVDMGLSRNGDLRSDFSSSGIGIEIGGVWKPENLPLRLGIAYRTPIETLAHYTDDLLPNSEGDLIVSGAGGPKYLPKTVAVPWDLNFGFAVQFGKRPFNPPWETVSSLIERENLIHSLRRLDRETAKQAELARATTPDEQARIAQHYAEEQKLDDDDLDRALRDAKWRIERDLLSMNTFYVQVSAAMLVSGQVQNAVGIESMLSQTVNRSGQKTVVSPRLGIESGVVPNLLKLRAGTYLEPTRFATSSPRGHITAGFDVKLAVWNVFGLWPDDYMWRLGFGGDLAHRYTTWGITLAGWYPRHQGPDTIPTSTTDPAATRLTLKPQ